MTSPRRYSPRQLIPTNPYPTDDFNRVTPILGNVSPEWEQEHMMQHGRYLSGVDGLGTCKLPNQKSRDGSFQVGPEREFMVESDEPDWSDALLGENEHEDDSVGSGIFDPGGGATVHTDMGVFADHPAVPGYIARNPPFLVNPEVTDITADAQVVEVPGGGLAYIEKGGINRAPPISPTARFEPYVSYPCQSEFHPRQPDSWAPPGGDGRRPLGMRAPPGYVGGGYPPPPPVPLHHHHHHLRSPGSPTPTEPFTPSPGPSGIPSALGPMPAPKKRHKTPALLPPGQSQPPPPAVHGFGACSVPQPVGTPYVVKEVPMWPRERRVPMRPASSLVPFQRIVEPIDMALPVCTDQLLDDARPPCAPPAPMGFYGFGRFGQDPSATDPNAPAPAPTTPAPAASSGPGIGSYAMAGVVVGVAAYLFWGAASGKAKR